MRWLAVTTSVWLAACGNVEERPTPAPAEYSGAGGYLFGVVGTALGALVGAIVGRACAGAFISDDHASVDEDHPDLSGLAGLVIGAAIGGDLGAFGGVSLYGAHALPPGRRGSPALALLGAAAGMGAAILLASAVGDSSNGIEISTAGFLLIPAGAADLAYGLSVPDAPSPPPTTGHGLVVPIVRFRF